jgi:hypothetical protein
VGAQRARRSEERIGDELMGGLGVVGQFPITALIKHKPIRW